MLYARVMKIRSLQNFQPQDKNHLEKIDQIFTSILLKAEKQVAPITTSSWRPALHQLNLIYRYWKIQNKGQRNNIQ
jgi:hypothetical protein